MPSIIDSLWSPSPTSFTKANQFSIILSQNFIQVMAISHHHHSIFNRACQQLQVAWARMKFPRPLNQILKMKSHHHNSKFHFTLLLKKSLVDLRWFTTQRKRTRWWVRKKTIKPMVLVKDTLKVLKALRASNLTRDLRVFFAHSDPTSKESSSLTSSQRVTLTGRVTKKTFGSRESQSSSTKFSKSKASPREISQLRSSCSIQHSVPAPEKKRI